MQFSFRIEVDRIISANELYESVYNPKTKSTRKYMPGWVKAWKDDVINQIRSQIPVGFKFPSKKKLRVVSYFFLNHKIDGRDLDNFCKSYYDSVKVAIGIDDRYYFIEHSEKLPTNDPRESIVTFVEVI